MERKKSKKQRADLLLLERGLAESSAQAQALIMSGNVHTSDRRIEKAGELLRPETELVVKGREHPWVSRGGMKLEHALQDQDLDVKAMICLDVGVSTGGFSDVLATRGAEKIYAVDVGHGQLAWKLRQDPRVVVMERTNARHLTAADIPDAIDLVVCDASFIGLRTILPACLALAKPGGWLIALIKPQFEVAKADVGDGGVVRDPALHSEVCEMIHDWLQQDMGWQVTGLTESPILGPEGNKEFLILARNGAAS